MAHCARSPSFLLHQVTCQLATGDTLFGPLNLSLEGTLCGLVGRNGVGKTRLLRLLAGWTRRRAAISNVWLRWATLLSSMSCFLIRRWRNGLVSNWFFLLWLVLNGAKGEPTILNVLMAFGISRSA